MTGPATTPSRYVLRVFGTLALAGQDEATVLGQHGHHRRRLALLAALAAAGERGWSRDQLLLFFWPESSQTKARHSLEQLIYALRTSLGDDLFATNNPVALNPGAITTDIAEFNEAIVAGRLNDAVNAYRGPFLEGFYLDNAPEFERWVEEERARLKGRYVEVLERLAHTADAARDHTDAVRWRRALVDTDPVSVKNAAGLMRALIRSGDHAAALLFAERFEATVSRELGTSAGPAIAVLVSEARSAAGTELLASIPGIDVPSADRTLLTSHIPTSGSVSPVRPSRRSAGRRLAAAMLAITAVTALVLATNQWRSEDRIPQSIAVLPLANVSRDSQDAIMVDVLTEELITTLSRIPDLQVMGRTSSFMFRGSTLGAQRIADSLRVTHLLEGGVLRGPEKHQVNVRLLDARGMTVWSGQYEPDVKDWSATQGDIASAVARELNLALNPRVAQQLRRRLTDNVAAYELYLQGRDPMNLRSASALTVAIRKLHEAAALDSNFAAAYAAMPFMYFGQVGGNLNAAQAKQFMELADVAARKALALDPDLPEAHAGMAVALTMKFRDMASAESELRRAIALGGTPRVYENLGRVLMWTGRHDEALAAATRAAADDPLSASATADLGEGLCVNGRYREGLATLEPLNTLQPPLRRAPFYQALCHMMQGNWKAAVPLLGDGQASNPWSPLLGLALVRSGDTLRARALETEALANWRETRRGAIRLAVLAASFGDRDKAFQWLDSTDSDGTATAAIMYPLFADLHADARFARFRERIGLKPRP